MAGGVRLGMGPAYRVRICWSGCDACPVVLSGGSGTLAGLPRMGMVRGGEATEQAANSHMHIHCTSANCAGNCKVRIGRGQAKTLIRGAERRKPGDGPRRARDLASPSPFPRFSQAESGSAGPGISCSVQMTFPSAV
ncbi:hypothetical protein GCM10010495_76890 [Kitasatospora herbaricolor]|nr:hypothetical protein GCM10010495_76890 [Kitasatospora herbaricolor]